MAEHLQKGGQLQLGAVVGVHHITLQIKHAGQHKHHYHRQGDSNKLQNICYRPAAPIAADIPVCAAHSFPPGVLAFWKILVDSIMKAFYYTKFYEILQPQISLSNLKIRQIFYEITMPPSTASTWPVIKEARSEARK